jgi:hypothetical protein
MEGWGEAALKVKWGSEVYKLCYALLYLDPSLARK